MIIEKGIYAYPWQNLYENNCNSYILGRKRAVLVDVGHQRHVNHLLRGMEADGISLDMIDLIVITHCHPDHHEAVPSFLNGRVKVTYHREEETYLREEGGALYQMMGVPVPRIPLEFYLKEGILEVDGDRYQIIHTPGHSPGAICIYWAERKVLVTGDLVFYRGVGRTDFPGGDGKRLIESIEKLRGLDLEILLPGHGEIILGKDQVRENFAFIEENYYAFL
jgi:glyoxylase-like metal-dependent hydrolase (beta-lactamase superfamily II)